MPKLKKIISLYIVHYDRLCDNPPSFPFPSSLIAARRPGERLSFLSGSGQSPAAKCICSKLSHFVVKMMGARNAISFNVKINATKSVVCRMRGYKLPLMCEILCKGRL